MSLTLSLWPTKRCRSFRVHLGDIHIPVSAKLAYDLNILADYLGSWLVEHAFISMVAYLRHAHE